MNPTPTPRFLPLRGDRVVFRCDADIDLHATILALGPIDLEVWIDGLDADRAGLPQRQRVERVECSEPHHERWGHPDHADLRARRLRALGVMS